MAVPGSLDQERIVEPAREAPIAGRSEVLVVGGGPAGVGAALAAARTGARTTLVEGYGFLGGMWTAGLLNPILDHHEKGGMVQEIVERLRAAGKLVEGPRANFDTEYCKYMLDRMMAEAGVEVRLYRSAVETICDRGQGLWHCHREQVGPRGAARRDGDRLHGRRRRLRAGRCTVQRGPGRRTA